MPRLTHNWVLVHHARFRERFAEEMLSISTIWKGKAELRAIGGCVICYAAQEDHELGIWEEKAAVSAPAV